jgi:hypothetical protein
MSAAAVLLSRGVQPSDIESMSVNQIEFWYDVAEQISQAEKQAIEQSK